MRLGILSEKYEGGGVGTISTGNCDSGGVSYGQFQLATNTGTVSAFVEYLLGRDDYGREYGRALSKFEPGTVEFSAEWLASAETATAQALLAQTNGLYLPADNLTITYNADGTVNTVSNGTITKRITYSNGVATAISAV